MASASSISSCKRVTPTYSSCPTQPFQSANGVKPKPQSYKFSPSGKIHNNLSSSYCISCNLRGVFDGARVGTRGIGLIVARAGRNSQENDTHLGIEGNPSSAKKGKKRGMFSLRLRPRLRLLSLRLNRIFIRDSMDDILDALVRNSKKVTISAAVSFALGLIFLFLKFTATPASMAVPYSDLISNLRGGHVTSVLFEEGSRRIFYNTACDGLDGLMAMGDVGSVATDALDGGASKSARKGPNGASATPKWQYVARKVDRDEKFLLDLMREKGTTYSSAPQSVLMSLRSILITIISLWIPLMPLMWWLYRQLSAANSPAKKRRPANQKVNFDDVEGGLMQQRKSLWR